MTDDADEQNAWVAEQPSPTTVVIADRAGSLRAGPGCRQVDAARVMCSLQLPLGAVLDFDGGGSDDTIDLRALPRGSITGGEGNDTLYVPGAGGYADPGPGLDRVYGGAGGDTVTDRGPNEADVYDLGGGANSIFYARPDPVFVDLRAGVGGARGEDDVLGGMTRAYGGSGNDTLLGTDQTDTLDGGTGSDVIDGRGGDDLLDGGAELPGRNDVIAGGAGDDQIHAAPLGSARVDAGDGDDVIAGGDKRDVVEGGRGSDTIQTGGGGDAISAGPGDDQVSADRTARFGCGSGRDLAFYTDLSIRPGNDCELVDVDEFVQATRAVRVVSRGRMALRIYCLSKKRSSPFGCRGGIRLLLRDGRRLRSGGVASYRLARGTSRRVTVRLTRLARRRLARGQPVSFGVRVTRKRRDSLGQFEYGSGEWNVRVGRARPPR